MLVMQKKKQTHINPAYGSVFRRKTMPTTTRSSEHISRIIATNSPVCVEHYIFHFRIIIGELRPICSPDEISLVCGDFNDVY